MQSGMGEAEREKLENAFIGSIAHAECPLEFGMNLHGTVSIIDGWLLPVIEAQRIHDWRNAIAADAQDSSMEEVIDSIAPSDLRYISLADFDAF
jgi:midasin